jgi:monoamine oxidase
VSGSAEVLIVGAGAAGLAAALEVARAGRSVRVLEARDRIGGRIFTRPASAGAGSASGAGPGAGPGAGLGSGPGAGLGAGPAAAPIELGAEFVHGRPASLWSCIEHYGLPTYELEGSQLWCEDGTLRGRTEPPKRAYETLEDMTGWLAQHSPEQDLSFTEYLGARGIDALRGRPARNYVEGFNAADAHRISVAALARQQLAEDAIEGERLFRIRSGYASLPQALAEDLARAGGRLHLSHPVQRIRWQRGAVSVACTDAAGHPAEFTAHQLVLTVPLGVLKHGAIVFEPAASELITPAARLEMGHVMRVVLEFSRAPWQDRAVLAAHPDLADRLRTLSFLFTPPETFATWWTPMPDPTPLLVGWAGGPRAERLADELGRDGESEGHALTVRRACIDSLARVFDRPPAELDAALIACHWHDWRADPFARGAYSYVPAGALEVVPELARPLEDTVFLAGEHTHTGDQWGTVHAALESGLRAARQVLTLRR